ncbi:MAG: DEAD/DEAH box helicase family protein [bacterium]|nr:DEAD/DEAH box helicase family protein [bacterium]
MLYSTFDSLKESLNDNFFTSRIGDYINDNLNFNLELREYQKEALGRFDFYFNGFQHRKFPVQILFHMATGSGKTLIMAANILYLYNLGYRFFIFFVNSTNIIEKTRDNFLNPLSEKYLFAKKIKYNEKEVFIKEVLNFEGVNPDNINILFTTIQGLHTRLNYPKENSLTYEDFTDKEIVLISDEAHHLQTLTKSKLTGNEEEEKKSWENTVEKIFNSNSKNILLEFTATIDLGNPGIRAKYEDKIIYQYDLKQFRLDRYSKEIEVIEADLEPVERALQAVIISQYRRKVAEKYKKILKPIILLKSKTIKESKENYLSFLGTIKNLKTREIKSVISRSKGTILDDAFGYFKNNDISIDNLISELKEEFSEEKCMLLDSENIDEEKQLKLNSLERLDNEVRAIFAVNMLNEGWDVLNLFDIVRLYETRDGTYSHGHYKPGNTTMGEAQLIGRGARYFPFEIEGFKDKYRRKFDNDTENELRILEVLHYHSMKNPNYIDEIKNALTEIGILPEKYVQKDLFIKDSFKKTEIWNKGIVFINDRLNNPRIEILCLNDAKIEDIYKYEFRTGEIKEEFILSNIQETRLSKEISKGMKEYSINEFGENLIRTGLDKFEFYRFDNLKKYFPHLKSIKEFINSKSYLAGVKVQVSGPKYRISNLTNSDKFELTLFIVIKISDQARVNTSEFIGSKLFKAKLLKEIFGKNDGKKTLKLDSDSERVKEISTIDLSKKDWYAQNEIFGTSEEKEFLKFFDEVIEYLEEKYLDIALLRNERYFQLYDFEQGRPFEPDFLLILREKSKKITILQVFIEPKGDQFKDSNGLFTNSAEGWKQKFLIDLETEVEMDLKYENKKYKLLGLPFFNEKLKKYFKEEFEKNI